MEVVVNACIAWPKLLQSILHTCLRIQPYLSLKPQNIVKGILIINMNYIGTMKVSIIFNYYTYCMVLSSLNIVLFIEKSTLNVLNVIHEIRYNGCCIIIFITSNSIKLISHITCTVVCIII